MLVSRLRDPKVLGGLGLLIALLLLLRRRRGGVLSSGSRLPSALALVFSCSC